MSALEQALDQHLRMADKHYQEWEDYYDALEEIELEKENVKCPAPLNDTNSSTMPKCGN